jgi:hypothetical protein
MLVLLALLGACTQPEIGWASGTWEGTATPQGAAEGEMWTLRLFHVGTTVTGRWSTPDASGSAEGSIRGMELALTLTREEPAQPTCAILALLTWNEELSGTYSAPASCQADSPGLGANGHLQLSKRRVR